MSLMYFWEVVRWESLFPLLYVMDNMSVHHWARPSEEYSIPLVSVRQQGSAKISVVPTPLYLTIHLRFMVLDNVL